jgi:hypothetical protein
METRGIERVDEDSRTDHKPSGGTFVWLAANCVLSTFGIGILGPKLFGLGLGTSSARARAIWNPVRAGVLTLVLFPPLVPLISRRLHACHLLHKRLYRHAPGLHGHLWPSPWPSPDDQRPVRFQPEPIAHSGRPEILTLELLASPSFQLLVGLARR